MSTPIEQFDATFANYSYAQRQESLRTMLLAHENANSVYLSALYDEYLKRYPLNSTIWNSYAKYIKATRSTDESEQIFSRAVKANPRSHDLWHCYVSSVRSDQADDKKIYEVTEHALEWIGYDYNSSIQWEDAICLQSENKTECLKLYVRALATPTKHVDDLYEKFALFFQYCSPEQINACYNILFPQETQTTTSLSTEAKVAQMKVVIDGSFSKAKQQLPTVEAFEKRLVKAEYDGTLSEEEYVAWKQYIVYGKENLPHSHVRFLYERALISQCENMSMWNEYLEYLEKYPESSISKELIPFCRSRELLFKSLNNIMLYIWAEYEELDGQIEQTRSIHKWATEQAKTQGEQLISRISRWVDFERRVKSKSEVIEAIFESNVIANASLSEEIRAWGINELSKLLAERGEKKDALDRRVQFFEKQGPTKISFVQLLEFISGHFSEDKSELERILDKTYSGCIVSCPTDQTLTMSKLSRSHLRSTKLSLKQIRSLETMIRAAESQKKLKEQLAKKRKNQQVSVDDPASEISTNGSNPVKHIKTN